LLMAGMQHRGFAMIDVISPCVTFNDHEGSTKSYEYTREHYHPAMMADFVPPAEEILAKYNEGEAISVKLHDGGTIVLRKLDKGYDPTSRISAITKLMSSQDAKEIVTGLLYIDESQPEMHELNNTSKTPLRDLPYNKVCPGNDTLQKLQARYR